MLIYCTFHRQIVSACLYAISLAKENGELDQNAEEQRFGGFCRGRSVTEDLNREEQRFGGFCRGRYVSFLGVSLSELVMAC